MKLIVVPIFQEKYDYFLSYFSYFLLKKGLKGQNQFLTYPILPTQFLTFRIYKGFAPIIMN